MDRKKKVSCPECGAVNEIDLKAELEKHRVVAMKRLSGDSDVRAPAYPEYIAVVCKRCTREFKIKVD